jgi:hypothetical protein
MNVSIVPNEGKMIPIGQIIPLATAPRIFFEDYLNELGPLPGEALLIGKVTDGLPLLINIMDEVRAHVVHVMSESRERSADYLHAVAYAIDQQFRPFYDVSRMRPEEVYPLVTYAVITYHPEEWQAQANYKYWRISVLDANKATSSELGDFLLETKAAWRHKRQYGMVMIDEMTALIHDLTPAESLKLLANMMRTPDQSVRFLVTSPFMDYADTHVTPIIANNDPQDHDFAVPYGQFKIKDGNRWLTFDVLYPKPG